MKQKRNFFETIHDIITHLPYTGRIWFIIFSLLLLVSIIGALITLSNRWTTLVPQPGNTYREAVVGTPRLINPVIAQTETDQDLIHLIYSGLVRIDEQGTIFPDLAESWTISPDGKTYTFILKPNLEFHDGKPLTSQDVIFTIASIQNSQLRSPLRVAWNGITVEAVNAQTVIFTLTNTYAGFLNQMTLGIIPEHIWKDIRPDSWSTNKYITEPIGSGPYKISSVHRNRTGSPDSFHLTRFNKFILGKPFIKHVVIIVTENTQDAYELFSSQKIDTLAAVSSNDVSELVSKNDHVIRKPLPRVFSLFFNTNNNLLLKDARVLQAIELGIDKETIINSVFQGYAKKISGPLPFLVDKETTDTESRRIIAKKTLDNSGWVINPETGFREKITGSSKQELTLTLTTAQTQELEQVTRIIAGQLNDIGIRTSVQVFDLSALNDQVIKTRNFQGLVFGQALKHDTDIYAFWHSSQRTAPGLNITNYINTTTDRLLEATLREPSSEKRYALYRDINNQLSKDAPVIFLYAPDYIYIANNRVHNMAIPPIGDSGNRFSLIYQWYINTDRVWNIFTKPTVMNK